MANTENAQMYHEPDSEIAYQNKDITAKYLTENLKGKTLKIYGLPELEIVDILPTNLPTIEANELRIDNLLKFSDGSIGIIDYVSSYTWEDKIKHVNYVSRILKRYERMGLIEKIKKIRLIIIFTADIEYVDCLVVDVGCMKVYIEPAYLVGIDTEEVLKRLSGKISRKEILSDEELMELIILPLTVKGVEVKQEIVARVIELAKRIEDDQKRAYVLSGVLTFSDKFIDKEFSRKVREEIMILNVIQYIIDDVKEETKEEVREENEAWFAGVIRKKMEKGYDVLAISDFLESPLADVESICDLIRANPDDTDLQIAKKSLEFKAEGQPPA